jgi:hypothetical protein
MTDFTGPPNEDDRSANAPEVERIVDVHVDALRAVLGANVSYGLADAIGAERWNGIPVAATYGYPIILPLLHHHRLPALSVWRQKTRAIRRKKQRERVASFGIRYWLDAVPRDHMPDVWPVLEMARELMMRTLEGHSVVSFGETPAGDPLPTSDLLVAAGFRNIEDIEGASDFASATTQARLHPLVELTFTATHEPQFGAYAYDVDALSALTELRLTIDGPHDVDLRLSPDDEEPAVPFMRSGGSGYGEHSLGFSEGFT